MRYEIIPRTITILLHDDADGVRPASGLEVLQLGHLGICYSLRGTGFYKMLHETGLAPFRQAGIDTVRTVVSPVHLRAMRQHLKLASVTKLGRLKMAGHEFELIAIRDNEAKSEPLFGAA